MPASKCSVGAIVLAALLVAAPTGLEAQERSDAEWWSWAVPDVLVDQNVWTRNGWVRIGSRDRRDRFRWHDRYRQDRFRSHDRYHSDRIGPFDRRRESGRQSWRGGDAKGPAFCRSGQGHPVFGRRWCLDKGFGLDRARWRRGDIGDIIFRRSPRRHGSILDRMGLEEILGDIILGRLLEGAGVHHRAPVTGRWLRLDDAGARVLQLRSDSRPLAELSDVDRDAVVDVLLWSDMEP